MISDIFLLCYSREYLQKPNFCVVFGSSDTLQACSCQAQVALLSCVLFNLVCMHVFHKKIKFTPPTSICCSFHIPCNMTI